MGNMIFNKRIMESNEAPPHQYDFDKYGKEFVSEEKLATVERRIFAQHMYGGPKGLGDPTYRYRRYVLPYACLPTFVDCFMR
jgi:hypothetical protein